MQIYRLATAVSRSLQLYKPDKHKLKYSFVTGSETVLSSESFLQELEQFWLLINQNKKWRVKLQGLSDCR